MDRLEEQARLEGQKKIIEKAIGRFLYATPQSGLERMALDLVGLHAMGRAPFSAESKKLLLAHSTQEMGHGLAALQNENPALFHRRFRVLCFYAPDYLHPFVAQNELADEELRACYKIGLAYSLYTPQSDAYRNELKALRKGAIQALLSEPPSDRLNGQIACTYALNHLAERVRHELGNVHADYKIPVRGRYTRPVAARGVSSVWGRVFNALKWS